MMTQINLDLGYTKIKVTLNISIVLLIGQHLNLLLERYTTRAIAYDATSINHRQSVTRPNAGILTPTLASRAMLSS